MKTIKHFWSYLAQFFSEWKMFHKVFVKYIKTHVLPLIFFCRKSWPLWDNVEEYCTAGQATEDNMEHARFIPDTYGYKHTLTICNTYCFSTATMIALTASVLR